MVKVSENLDISIQQTKVEKRTGKKSGSFWQKVRNFFGFKKAEGKQNPYKEFVELDNSFNKDILKLELTSNYYIAERDAIPDCLPKITLCGNAVSENVKSSGSAVVNGIDMRYEAEFKDYVPKDKEKYNKVLQAIKNSRNFSADDPRAIGIANMVCALSERYGVDPEITAAILDHETGGFQFTEAVMVHPGSKYKGVMQVDPDCIRSMYADEKDAKNTELSEHERAIAYDHRHYRKDQARIDELKKLYPTADELYEAIQHDVSLGVEVGLMVYKSKLSVKKGNTREALAAYCGSQYKLPSDTTAVTRIYPIPEYSGTA